MGCGASQNRQLAIDVDARIWGGMIKLKPKRAALQKDVQYLGKQDPYVKVNFGTSEFKTGVSEDGGTMPIWKDEMEIPRNNEDDILVLSVWNKNILINDEFLGEGALALTGVKDSLNPIDRNVILYQHGKRNGELIIELKFELDPKFVSHPEVLAPNTKGKIKVYPKEAILTRDVKLFGTMSPICTCRFGDESQSSSVATDAGINPKWMDSLLFERDVQDEVVQVEVWNFSESGDNSFIGAGFFSITSALTEPVSKQIEKTVNLFFDNATVGNVKLLYEYLSDEPQAYRMDYERQKQDLLYRLQNKDAVGFSAHSGPPPPGPQQFSNQGPPPPPPPPPPQQNYQQPQQQQPNFQQQNFQQQNFQQQPMMPPPQQPGYAVYMQPPVVVYPLPPGNGFATYTYQNGDVYTGNFANGMRNGQGKCVHRTGAVYDGQWVNDVYDGEGYITVGDFQYKGHFTMGKKNGKGVGTWTNGTKYDGDWLSNNMHGIGLYTQNGVTKKAQFANGTRVKYIDDEVCLVQGRVLNYNVPLLSANGLFAIMVAFDGQIIVINNSNQMVLWQMGTFSRGPIMPPFYLKLENNGSLVAFDCTLVPYWTSAPIMGMPPFQLIMGDDGKAAVHHQGGPALWLN